MRSGTRLVISVLRREGDDLRRDRAEFDRPLGEPLRGLPQRGVLQVAAPDRADDRPASPAIPDSRAGCGRAETTDRRGRPASGADRRARSRSCDAADSWSSFGRRRRRRNGSRRRSRCRARRAPGRADSRTACRYIVRGSGGSTIASRNMRVPRFSVYQLGRGSEPVIVVGSMMSLVPRYISRPPKISVAPRFPAARRFT